jgi:hypothetical protein
MIKYTPSPCNRRAGLGETFARFGCGSQPSWGAAPAAWFVGPRPPPVAPDPFNGQCVKNFIFIQQRRPVPAFNEAPYRVLAGTRPAVTKRGKVLYVTNLHPSLLLIVSSIRERRGLRMKAAPTQIAI